MSIRPNHNFAMFCFVCFLCGCGSARESETLDRFAQGYADFRNVQMETEVLSWVIVVNAKKETGSDNFWSLMNDSFKSKTEKERAKYANLALLIHENQVQPELSDLESRIAKLDGAVLKLFECAGAIKIGDYKEQAVTIAKTAREIHDDHHHLRRLMMDRFDSQTGVLRRIVEKKGAWPLHLMKKEQVKVTQISAEIDQIRKRLEKANTNIQDSFHRLKGQAGLHKYPDAYDKQKQT